MATEQSTITIDATDRPIGRLASEVASYLRGKRNASFAPHLAPAVHVVIQHIDRVKVDEKKLNQNRKWRNTGYPGGMRSRTWQELYADGPDKLFMAVIHNMLPNNKLRPAMLRHITFEKN